jgi:hypothetical protein
VFKEKDSPYNPPKEPFVLRGHIPNLTSQRFRVGCPVRNSRSEKKSFSVAHNEIDAAKGRVNVLERSLHFPEIRFNLLFLNNIVASFQMDGGQLTLTAKGKETGLLQAGSALKLLPTHWTFKGTDTLAITATVDGTGRHLLFRQAGP